jgi:hypothetical protein
LLEAPYALHNEKNVKLLEHDEDKLIDYASWVAKFAGFRRFKKESLLEEGDIADNYIADK